MSDVEFTGDPVMGIIKGLAIIALVAGPWALCQIANHLRDIANILRRK